MESVKNYIIKQLASNKLSQDEAKKMLLALKAKAPKAEDGVAIIGMACKLPGAKNTEEYWDNLLKEVNCIKDFPEARKEDLYSTLSNPIFGKIMYDKDFSELQKGNEQLEFAKSGYLDDIDKFDAGFFHIPPREAKFIDPLHRLFLETAWEAIEDGGYGGKKIYGTKTGVYIGRDNAAYSNYSMVSENDPMHLTGSYAGLLASRLSYLYNLRGPGMVIDTACSSGAVAIHQACMALKNNECDFAIASGVNMISIPKLKGQGSLEMVESKDSKVRTFDKNANGTVWGEGIGVLLLKKLSKAIEDKDNIYAVIKGSAVNNDGASNGITAPNAEAQEEVIVQAWKDANVNPETIAYIEAHGTGTVLGDPIEIKGLENAFRRFTDKKQFCGIGSVKPSLGHLVSASGLAGVIKVVLSLKNGILPASMNFEDPNPYINFCDSPVYVNDQLRLWKENGSPRRAGVSSFGFSGTNCHIVLEEAPIVEKEVIQADRGAQLLTISARSESGLSEFINRYASFLSKGIEYDLQDICYTANTGRSHLEYRIAFIAESLDDLKRKIAFIKGSEEYESLSELGIFYGRHNVVHDSRKTLDLGDITEEQKSNISLRALTLLERFQRGESTDNTVLAELCKLYAEGAEIAWEKLYSNRDFKHVPLPVYPFERTRLWANQKEIKLEGFGNSKKPTLDTHPLFDSEAMASMDRYTLTTIFDTRKHWVLSDHRIMGNFIVPGTTYLEMAKEAGRLYYKEGKIELRDIIFMEPLIVGDEGKEAQTIVKNVGNHLEFFVASSTTADSNGAFVKWTVHVEGKIYPIGDEIIEVYKIGELISKCNVSQTEFDINKEKERTVKGPFEFGERWNNINKIYAGNDEALVLLRLPDKLYGDTESFHLHPSLMDNAVNAFSQSIGDGTYLPLSYKSIKVYGSLPSSFYSYIRTKDAENSNRETIMFDIVLLTEESRIITVIEDYVIKKVHKDELRLKDTAVSKDNYYDLLWVESDMREQPQENENGSILLFRDVKGASELIADKLVRMGNKVYEIELGASYEKIGSCKYTINGVEDDYRKLLADIKKETKITRILHMLSITPQNNIEGLAELEQMKSRGLYSLFRLAKAMASEGYTHEISLILAAEHANKVFDGDKQINPLNSAFFGLGRVIAQEYQNIKCKCIDIDEAAELSTIIPELLSDDSSYGTAYRKGKRYEPCFTAIKMGEYKTAEIKLREDGVYIITGGTGGIGIEIARHLTKKAKDSQSYIKLALVNRSAMPEENSWDKILQASEDKKLCAKIQAIRELQSYGAKVECFSADISNEAEVMPLVESIKVNFGKINGIIHSAGVAGDGFLIRKAEKTFKEVIAPKINGAWLLHKATEAEELDFFVLFSSVATLVPSAGQGDYTAANSYLDAFAAYRNSMGKKTLCINWPAWSETGMAVEHGKNDNSTLFRSIATANALAAFDELMSTSLARAYIGELNYKVIISMKGELPIAISQELKAAVEKYSAKPSSANSEELERKQSDIVIKGIEADKLDKTQGRTARIWAEVFDIQEIDIYSDFYDMGGDSILAAQLLKEIDKAYPDIIGISDIFSYPSVIELSSVIDERTGQSEVSENEDMYIERQFEDLLESIGSGDMSIEEGLSRIKEQRN